MLYKWKSLEGSNLPLYVQLAEHIRSLISTGRIKSGSKLPSREKLVSFLKVSKVTVSSALALLAQEGVLTAHNKARYTVTENWKDNLPDWYAYVKRAKHKPGITEYRYWADADGLTDFGMSSDFTLRPFIKDAFKTALDKIDDSNEIAKFTKYGYKPLLEALAVYFNRIGIESKPENILICQNIIHLLYPLYESLMTSGSNFLHEQANLIMTISNIHSIGMNMLPVAMDQSGLSVTALEKHTVKHKHPVLHIDPTDHAPTGIVMSKKRKLELMNFVTKHRIPVVEIDHFREIWHDKPFPAPLKAMDKLGNVIYVGSFVRSYPFDIQVSWIVADPYIIEHLSDVMVQTGVKASFLNQIAAADLISSGKYDEITEAMRAFVRQRREKALALCRKYLQGMAQWEEKHCSFHFWLNFPGVNIRKLGENSEFKGFYPGYFFEKNDKSHILLCPASIKEDELEETIRTIALMVKTSQSMPFSSKKLNIAYKIRRGLSS